MGKVEVVYEDNHIIVVVKPPNILTQGDNTGDDNMVDILKHYLKEKYNKPGNVYVGLLHRLDRPVGGLLVFAKTSKAASRLSENIRQNDIDRKYLAIVHGETKKSDVLVDYLKKDEKTNTVKAFSKQIDGSKMAKLSYETLQTKDGLSLVEVTLFTGRSHQIRVQLSNNNHPIYGDMKYGKQEKGNIALFCYKLSIIHPTKKEWMHFNAKPSLYPFNMF